MGNQIKKLQFKRKIKNKDLSRDNFQKLKTVGKGSFGKVYLVQEEETRKIFAMKVLNKKEMIKRKQVKHVITEKKILERIKSPFIIDHHSSFQNKEKIFFVMEYLNGGDLFDRLSIEKFFTEKRVLFYAASIILALQTMHKHGAIYRDLKPENILIDSNGYIKLIDFGLSRILKSKNKRKTKYQKCKTCCGTVEYIAPEVILGQKYGIEVDYWSLGILIYEMLHGRPPFYSENKNVMYEKIIYDDPKISSSVSSEMQNLIRQLLNKNPEKRLGSPYQFKNIHDHPVFIDLDWQKLYEKKYQPEFIPKGNEFDNSQFNSQQAFQKKSKSLLDPKKLNLEPIEHLTFKGFYPITNNTQILKNVQKIKNIH
ncbi:non-specific serine/threonine protein kinase [Anaeramoeba flamelloides]|uniref:Non-specific serine/threonine protein kinase n=1 Tax=Anaeramoeba flamelloides TaxID=1746091 RepID=A0ABQ8ZFG0_9EUKA|nr:non-specific serine/threonine protein kinase [Anaeramoeba flamelloides]